MTMAVELPNVQISAVAPLFDAVAQDQTFIRAARRNAKTRLVVDNAHRPSIALLWPPAGGVMLLAGPRDVRREALADVVGLLLSLGAGQSPGLRLALPHAEWSRVLYDAFGHAFAPRQRRSYTFVDEKGPERSGPSSLLGAYELRPMDEPLARDAAADADPELADYWPHVPDFVKRGIGFCAVESASGRVASAAWSVFDPIDLVEIGVGTSKAHRGRGLAPVAAAQVVRHCRARGLDPRWSTDFDNIGSRRVAAKIGFGNPIEHDWPLYTPFNAARRSIDVPEERTRPYHGRYTANGVTITIGHDGRALRFYDNLGQTLTLAAENETRFFLREVPIQLEFTRDATGAIDGFTREQGGKQWRMERIAE